MIIFKNFKNDNKISRNFLNITFGKNMIHSVLLIMLFKNVNVQIILYLVIEIIYLLAFLKFRPMKKMLNNV